MVGLRGRVYAICNGQLALSNWPREQRVVETRDWRPSSCGELWRSKTSFFGRRRVTDCVSRVQTLLVRQ
jgi:hypothetical protein